MKRRPRSELTVDELISTLNHSNLPTVLIEGDTDLIVFRTVEDDFSGINLSVLPAGGRTKVLGVFDRKGELRSPGTVFFLADKDVWAVTGIPDEYVSADLAFTTGYSIENDLYVDGRLEQLMDADETAAFRNDLNIFVDWYALAFSRHLISDECAFEAHPNVVLDDPQKRGELTALREGEIYPAAMQARLLNGYRSLIRGKSLLGLLMRRLSYKGRAVRHNHLSLCDMAAHQRGPLIALFFHLIAAFFDTTPVNA